MKKTLLIAAVLLITIICQANTITVTNTNDSGAGSLRQAAIDAASGDTIRFDPGLLTAAVDSISLATEVDFGNKGIVIKGLYTATDTLFISGANTSRIFSFIGAGKVVLDSLVLINGNGQGTNSNGDGGAVLYDSGTDTLHVVNSVIRNNSAANGGGVYGGSNFSINISAIAIINSTIMSNTTTGSGGGIASVSANSSSSITVSNSNFSNNTASNGGGIHSFGYDTSSVTVCSSTFSNNSAPSSEGGGIHSLSGDFASEVTVSNSTFSNNSSFLSGGGISSYSVNNNTEVTISSSILSESDVILLDGSPLTSNGYNIFSDAPSGTVGTDQINVTPAQLSLGLLQNNGGTTPTMMPGTGSVAIDAGNPSDMSHAQNVPIIGVRDIGAAEYCTSSHFISHTECNSFTWANGDGNTYTNDTIVSYIFANGNSIGCDSVITLDLTINSVSDLTTSTSGTTITSNNSSATYQWLDCDNNFIALTGENGSSFTALVNGNYAVELTENGCVDTSTCVAITAVGVFESSFGNDLSIYPNPTSGNFSIDLGAEYESSMVSITDVSGKIVFTKSMAQSQVLNLSIEEPAGIYIVSIQAGDQKAIIRLVKE